MIWQLRQGDCIEVMRGMEEASVQTCITSPPYFGLRDYGVEGQLGLEATPDLYVAKLVEVFREVKRVLRDDGTLWLNVGDSYAANRTYQVSDQKHKAHDYGDSNATTVPPGMKPKDLMGIPWMVAFALRADGWYLRSEIIWAKPNPMPESVTDRPTKAHEQVFLLSKSASYYYDADAIRETPTDEGIAREGRARLTAYNAPGQPSNRRSSSNGAWLIDGRNKRSVWTIATQPYPEAHFATFPEKLVEPMVLAGCPAGGMILDPFAGSGTTLKVALERGRHAVGIELNPQYVELAQRRLATVTPPLFTEAS